MATYLNVLVCFGETFQTAVVKKNLRIWIGFFQRIDDGSAPKDNYSTRKRKAE